MRAYAQVRLQDGSLWELGPGDFIGRLPSSALPLDDARVSEAHALVSLRGKELRLLALRGRFALGARPLGELTLEAGQVIQLAQGLSLEVVQVVLPPSVLAIRGEGLPQQILSATVSLVLEPRVQLISRYVGDADAWIWTAGDWRVRIAGAEPEPLEVGTLRVRDRLFEIVPVALETAGEARTEVRGGVAVPFRLVATYDTVHFHRAGHPTFTIRGIPARLFGELVACGVPVAWTDVAHAIWPKVEDHNQLRRLWDITLARVRRKLRAVGIRPGLLHSDGCGNIELLLEPEDRVEDRT